jgi:hypothetical protein
MRIVRLGTITTLGVLAVAAAVAAGPRSRDVNRAHRGSAPQVAVEADVSDEADGPSILALPKTIAIVSLPAPSTDVAIDITVANTSSASPVGARDIQAVIIDCARGLAKQGLTMDSVFNVVPPAGGTATVTTGNDADDVGPAVLTFTGFGAAESSTASYDPDTWDNAGFGATRANLAGCRVEVVFFGAESLRGDGVLKLVTGSDTVVAKVKQRFPAP